MSNRAERRAAPAAVSPDGYQVLALKIMANDPAQKWWIPWRAPVTAPVQLMLLHSCGWGQPFDGEQVSMTDLAATMGVHGKTGCRR